MKPAPPKKAKRPARVRLSLDVPPAVKTLLDKIRIRESRSYTEIIRRALEAYEKNP